MQLFLKRQREESAGVMLSDSPMNQETETYVYANVFPDNAFATADITGVQCTIDRNSIQNRFCQNCLDTINTLWFTIQPTAEYAIISFEDQTIQSLLNVHPWFSAGNYGIDVEFKVSGDIDLLIHYFASRYE